jgi:hypothetical protein
LSKIGLYKYIVKSSWKNDASRRIQTTNLASWRPRSNGYHVISSIGFYTNPSWFGLAALTMMLLTRFWWSFLACPLNRL